MRLAALAVTCIAVPAASAADAMPVAQQNGLVQKYCAVCHTDAARNGGLSLEHYDAATAAPSLAAMMLSKLTSGVALETVRAASSDADAAELLAKKMKTGAINAAGLGLPDQRTIDALVSAFVSQAAIDEWDISTRNGVTTASITGESPATQRSGEAAIYRLIVACDIATGKGDMQLAWSPLPQRGTLLAAADGMQPLSFEVSGTEKMGNGDAFESGPAAVYLYQAAKLPLPAKTLEVSNLFPDQQVAFRFDTLEPSERKALSACAMD